MQQYEPMLKAQLKSLSLYRDLEDYYQCALVALWKAYEQFEEGKGYFGAYAKQTVRGYLLVQLQRERRHEERFAAAPHTMFEMIPAEEQTDLLDWDVLSPEQCHVIQGHFYGGKSMSCLAQEMGLSIHQVRYLHRTALKLLQASTTRVM